jgi:hypothetical protein
VTSTSTSSVDLGAVAEAVASCPSVLRLHGRRVRGVRVVDGVVEVHVVARWVAFLPDVAEEVRAAVEPLVGSHPVTVFIDDVGGASGRAAIGREAAD